MLSPIVTTILSYIVVIIVSYVSYRISNYYIRKGKGSAWVLVNATFSSTLCFSILSTYVNDIYALVYQGDYEVIKKTMSIMLLLTLLHTFIVFPFLALLDYDKSGDVIFASFKNRYSLLFSIEFFMVFLMLLGVITDLLLGHSADPVYVLLRQSASDKFPYVTYLLGFGFLIGIPTFLVYFSVGMVAIPIADILNYRRARKNKEASVFDYSGPVVEYVAEEESAESEPEQYISTLNEAGVNGNSIALLQQSRSRSVPKATKQTVVIKSHYNEGWVSMVFESHPKVRLALSCVTLCFALFIFSCLISGFLRRLTDGEWNYGFLDLLSETEDTLLDTILFALDEYHLDVIFFAILVIFVAWTCMQGQIVAGVRLFLGEPLWLKYLNTSATTMLVFLFNNVTSTFIILSMITMMAPHYTMFGTQHTTVGSQFADCTLTNAFDHAVDCQLSAVSSFFITLDSQTIVFGWIEMLIPCVLVVIVLVVVLWPFISQHLSSHIPYSVYNFFETMNWMQFGKGVDQSLLSHQNEY
ncbi:hypothetical protein WA556_000701 [Blastocystis sp. ATCC 50177/Nand II]